MTTIEKMRTFTSIDLQVLWAALPTYKKNLETAKKGFEAAKAEGVFLPDVEKDLTEFIGHTEKIMENMEKCIALIQTSKFPIENGDSTEAAVQRMAEELNGYHEYILDADIYLLVFIKEELDDRHLE